MDETGSENDLKFSSTFVMSCSRATKTWNLQKLSVGFAEEKAKCIVAH
jgi:hypothetical protein